VLAHAASGPDRAALSSHDNEECDQDAEAEEDGNAYYNCRIHLAGLCVFQQESAGGVGMLLQVTSPTSSRASRTSFEQAKQTRSSAVGHVSDQDRGPVNDCRSAYLFGGPKFA
jgi:hypothetical protein